MKSSKKDQHHVVCYYCSLEHLLNALKSNNCHVKGTINYKNSWEAAMQKITIYNFVNICGLM